MNTKSNPEGTSRRLFVKTTGAAVIGSVLAPSLSLSSRALADNSDTLKVGLIGCGGRGSGAAIQALTADKNVVLTAMGDAFENRLQDSLANFKKERPGQVRVDPDHCFVGFDAYKKVIESGVDVVILATPPGFRPAHLKAAVDAGKHIFCEKPMAVDAPGVRSVMESAKIAKEKKLSLVSGFCWRYNLAERAGMQQIHDGAIGDVRAVYSTYNTGSLWCYPRKPEWTDMEAQMRNWYYFTWICGDFIVEQACHSIDKMLWAMGDTAPLKAVAHGGRQVRTGKDFGHIFDHFSVVYEFPKAARGFLFCRQQANCSDDNTDTIMGSKGVARILGFAGVPEIKGENNWKYAGKRPNMYQVEHDELFASIRAGKPMNDGAFMAQSTMTAILGRMAAYTGKSITWDEALNSKEDLSPAKYDFAQPMSIPPVAMPGVTQFL